MNHSIYLRMDDVPDSGVEWELYRPKDVKEGYYLRPLKGPYKEWYVDFDKAGEMTTDDGEKYLRYRAKLVKEPSARSHLANLSNAER